MPRRLPTFFPLTLVATVGLFALTSALTAQPPTPAPPAAGTDDDGSRIKSTGEANYKAYKQFAEALLRLAQKWEKGSPEEQERAKAIRAALAIADQKGVDRLFKDVSSGLKGTQNPTTPEFKKLLQDDKKLIAALNEILVALETEGETARLKKDIDNLKKQIEETKAILREQENLRARTEGKGAPDKIAKDQGNLAKRTQDLADQLAGKSPSKGGNDPKNPKDDKSEQKSKAKPGDKAAEPKDDTKDSKSSDKAGGEPKDSASQKGGPKDGMMPDGGSSKESPKDGGMSDPMAGGAKPMGDPKGGEPKDPMGGMNPSEPKPPMGSDPMAAKPSPGDNKSQGMGKGESKPSKGQQGGDSKPMNSPGSPSPSQQGSSKGSPSPPSPSSPSPPSPSSPQNPNAPAQKNLDEAVPDQKGAQKDLNKPDRREASKKEDQAIQKIKQALDELEKRLKQLREKEMAKKLQDLEQRVKLMLEMQKTILAGTEGIDSKIRSNRGSIVDQDRLNSQALSEKEQTIVDEADRALDLLKGEGSAVVFAGVLGEVRKDMEAVRDQLQSTQVGEETQLVERQIIAQLERMLKALEKAQQDLKPPPPPMPGEPPPPSDPKKDLIKLVEQLKLLRELQVQVNERTALFGKKTPGAQATDKFVVDQLKLLGERQRVLQEMLQKIASGDQ